MKLLAAFGLLAVVFAASTQWPQHERAFTKGNSYEFEWKGQIVSGVPVKGSSSHSIQQIRSKVIITVNEKHSILRLDNVKLSNGHKQLTEPRIISEVSLTESELTSEQREQIKLPIRFRYHQGIVSEIVFSEEETAWSENIKRSVLNMLQVQMKSSKSQEEYEQEKYNSPVQKNKFFTVTERTLEGECEVAYTIVESEKTRDLKEVTKSLNFEKCPKRVDIRYGPRYSAECENCEATDARPESQSVFSYKVRGDDEERFLVSEVELKSEYVYTPFAKEQEVLATYVHQKLRLINVKSAERVEEPRNGKKSSLLYNYEMELARERFWMNGEEDTASYKLTGFEGIPKKELMVKYVRMIVNSMKSEKEGVTLETSHNFARLVEIFRMCTEREIQEIHRHFWEVEENEKVREFLIDALIAAGTKNTVEHFIEKCEKKQISPVRAAMSIKGLVNIRIPSEKIVYSLIRLSKSKVCREEPTLRQSVLLTTGALMNGVCSKVTKDSWAFEIEGEKECRRELKTEWLKTWENLFEEAPTRYEKVLILKSVANSALDVSVHFLEKVINDRRHPIVVRQSAIDALRMLREQMPRKVQSICLPLFKSRREPVALRISALYQLVHSRPERSLLDQIVHQLNVEPSLQLRSFGVSLLRSLAESKKNPCEIKLGEKINVSLRMLRASPVSASNHVHLPWYSRNFDFGLTMDLASIFSNESMLPHELLASVDSIFAGSWNKHLFQVGLYQNNLDQVLIPLLKKLETETPITRGQRSQTQPLRETLKELARQMKIQSRKSEYNGEDAFGMLYLRYKNLDFAVIPAEEELIQSMIRDSSYTTSDLIKKITRGFNFEGTLSGYVYEYVRIVPTTFGLPLQVTAKLPTVGSIKAFVKAEYSPKMLLRVKMEPSVVATHVAEMTVFSPEMHIGARVFHSAQSTLPVEAEVEYNFEKNILKTNIRLPKEETRVFLLDSRPTTFVRSVTDKKTTVLDEKIIRIPSFEKTSVHYEQTYGEELFGLRTEVIGSFHRRFYEKKSPESLLFGENHFQIVVLPTEESMKEVVIELEHKYNTEKSFESPRYDETFTEQEFGLETSDESEERQDERTDRRTHSKKYYESMKSLKGPEGRLVARIHTIGGPKNLKGEMSMQGSCDEELKVCRFEIEGKRSPLLEKETREWNMNIKGDIVLPETPKTIDELKEMRHKEVEATLKCRWGSDEKNEMTIRLQKTQSQEMARLIKDIDYETNKGLEKYDMLREVSKLNKYVVVIEKELSEDNEQTLRRVFDLIKSEFYMDGVVEGRRTDSTRRVKIEAVIEPEECKRVNFTVECNGETLTVNEALFPIRIPMMSLGSRRPTLKGLNKNSWTSMVMSNSECEVSSSRVNTFDGLVYKTPLTTCYSVLAKDCSSQEPEYAVMMKKMEKNSEEKKLKIVTAEKEIECELKNEKVACKVDGRRVEEEESLYEHGIKLIGESSCEIEIRNKMTVRFDGYTAEIKADKRTENTQCGLCGHFDGNRDNEFRRADNEETEDIEEFHRSWLRRDSECEIEESKLNEKKNYGVESDEEERYDSEESLWKMEDSDEEYMGSRSRKMLKKNLKKHITRKNVRDEEENTYEPEKKIIVTEREGKTCFSMEEHPKCHSGDETLETESKKAKFACLPRSDRRTRRIENALKRGEESIKGEIYSLSMTYADRIEVPKLCRVY